MSEIGAKILLKLDALPGIFPEKAIAEEVSRRVAEWLTAVQPEPTCSVRAGGNLVIASKRESALNLMVTQPSFQFDDSDFNILGGERRGGPSIIPPGTPVTVVEFPLSDILGEVHE